ncbi:hypothetical protein BXZ70DRAFT_1037782 [Cristinia sonorae]|uniref:Uncharacterized protein n=1 Tax=Cristinia sonorae TaxID=1940300 RepID=A0A8K0UXA7_9AGAR|nr:hypothetical protein BXZ70DRAFT_1037782 [Cristinia sonorae]
MRRALRAGLLTSLHAPLTPFGLRLLSVRRTFLVTMPSTRWYTPILLRRSESLDPEVIYDSEPEREEVRKEKKVPRKARNDCRHPSSVQPTVIELSSDTDSESPSLPLSPLARSDSQVIEIPEDVSSPMPMPPSPIASDKAGGNLVQTSRDGAIRKTVAEIDADEASETFNDSSLPSFREFIGMRGAQSGVDLSSGGCEPESAPVVECDSLSDSSVKVLNLQRFAFEGPQNLRRAGSSTDSRGPSVSRLEPSNKPQDSSSSNSVRSAASVGHAFTDIPDRDLARVLKCVCCGHKWTARKSIVQRMKHIQTCGKKLKYTNDTMKAMLRKEIENSPPVKTKSKTKASDVEKEEAPRTLLEDAVVNDATDKRRGRRPLAKETVMSITDTRSDIIARARLLLSDKTTTGNSPTIESRCKSSEASELAADGGESMPHPSTQPFGDSALARMFQPRVYSRPPSPTQAYIPTQIPPDSPPPTQTLGDSVPARKFSPHTIRTPSKSRSVVWPTDSSHRPVLPEASAANGPPFEDVMDVSSDTDQDLLFHRSKQMSFRRSFDGSNPPTALYNSLSEPHRRPPSLSDRQDDPPDIHAPSNNRWDFSDNDDAILYFSDADDYGSTTRLDDNLDVGPVRGKNHINSTPRQPTLFDHPIHNSDQNHLLESPNHINRHYTTTNTIQPSHSPSIPSRPSSQNPQPHNVTSAAVVSKLKKHPSRKKRGDDEIDDEAAPTRVSMTDEELGQRLKAFILADANLYRQVLRYEVWTTYGLGGRKTLN